MNGCSRWSWIPYLGNDDSSQNQSTWVRLRVGGRALQWLQQGRLLAYGSTWCPVRILHANQSQSRSATTSTRSEPARQETGTARRDNPEALSKRPAAEVQEGDSLLVEACLPSAVTSQVRIVCRTPEVTEVSDRAKRRVCMTW